MMSGGDEMGRTQTGNNNAYCQDNALCWTPWELSSDDRHFLEFYSGVVGPYWPAERRHIEANYTTLPFPFEELPHPEFGLTLRWSLDQVLGYVSSWSATARYRKARGDDPVPLLRASLQGAWPGEGAIVEIRLPIGLRAAKLD